MCKFLLRKQIFTLGNYYFLFSNLMKNSPKKNPPNQPFEHLAPSIRKVKQDQKNKLMKQIISSVSIQRPELRFTSHNYLLNMIVKLNREQLKIAVKERNKMKAETRPSTCSSVLVIQCHPSASISDPNPQCSSNQKNLSSRWRKAKSENSFFALCQSFGNLFHRSCSAT